jgi:O-succinylbenzoic acid--CoA ligase
VLELDWENEKSYGFVNPRFGEADRKLVEQTVQKIKGHVILMTSGSCQKKAVALSKPALLASAQAVNAHIGAAVEDIWVNPLPHYHVGGLSIYARAFLAGSYVVRYDAKWDPKRFCDTVIEKKGTLSSLVPTQLYDLIQADLPPPKSLRWLFIGGQALPMSLYEKARDKKWPVVPTFGMTEASSQVASASLDSPELKLLSHVKAKTTPEGRLMISSSALLTGYFNPDFFDPKIEGWFMTDDFAEIKEEVLTPKGRSTDWVKIKGELINLFELEAILENLKAKLQLSGETILVPVKDERAGFRLTLYHTAPQINPLVDAFNAAVLPEAAIKATLQQDSLPKTALGKLIRNNNNA